MKNIIPINNQLPYTDIQGESGAGRRSLKGIWNQAVRMLSIALFLLLPLALRATLTLPAIPSNSNLAARFELNTEMTFRVKVGETYLPSGALIAYINNEIRGAQTASVLFPPTGINVYKLMVFNNKAIDDSISFKYYDLLSDKVYDIKEKIAFVPNQVPDYANPIILNAFCQPISQVSGLLPADGKENLNTTLDLFWQPSPNTTYYNLFLWEDGKSIPSTPSVENIYSTSYRLYNLKYSQLYHWKIVSKNDCSFAESTVQSFNTRKLPDLTVESILAPANVESGSNFTISYKVKNIGAGNTVGESWNDAVYVSNDQTFSNDDLLLSSKTNIKQLATDSTYIQSVTVAVPNEYVGDYYFFVKTDMYNSVAELSEDNNQAKATNAIRIALKSLPDILVKDIQADRAKVSKGDSLTISWKVENIGGVTATGGWIERISLIPVSGPKLTIEPNFGYKASLPVGTTINRSGKLKLPDILRFSGEADIEVELVPYPELQEHAANKANNKAISANKLAVTNDLFLEFQTASVLENSSNPVRCILTRSGDYNFELAVTLSASVTGQVTIPASVTIPANQSSVVFNLSPINNAKLEGSRDVDITAIAAGYNNAVKPIEILDDEIPVLTALLSKTTATEGETIKLTVTRDLVTGKALTVNLSTVKPAQWTFPATLIIPANTASGEVSVVITDDNVPELKGDAIILAGSAGFTTGQATVSIVDNDIPEVSLELLADTVSEASGIYSTWGLIKRVKGDGYITVNLSSSLPNALFFPASITLPKGALEQKFNIGVVDNAEVDGYRKATITGSVYISSCNCGTTAENGGIVNRDLVIADNDGPSLSVFLNPVSLPEGKQNAGLLTISRNTPPDLPLNVTIFYTDTTEISIQTSATIPAGQKSVQVPVSTKNDGIEDGNQMVSVQASAFNFSSGFGYVFVSDLNKPDLIITDIALNKTSVATNDVLEITGSAFNGGYATAPSGVKINFYFSKDKTIDAADIQLGDYSFPASIAQNTPADFVMTADVPDETGSYYILAKINPAEAITELVYFNNESEAISLTVTPEYTATAVADNNLYLPNTTVPIHGTAVNSQNVVMPNVEVDVYIVTGGTRRELKAKTNSLGLYSVDFVPNPNESGHYIIGACFPKQNLSAEQDKFDIPGMMRDSGGNIIWEMKQGQILTGKIGIKNTSEAQLSQIVMVPDRLPLGCDLKFDTIAVLPGNETREFNFTLKATELTVGQDYEKINFKVKSLQGGTLEFPAYYYCQALQGQLVADPVSINTSMTKGKSRLYEIKLSNNGAGATGAVTISLPNVKWMTLVTPATLANIAPQDTSTVILNLTPTSDTPLNTPITGSIAVNCVNGNGALIPYRFEVVSEETGGLKVDVVDEYTLYTETKPHVQNAHVVVRHPFSGKVMADGFTGEDGTFTVANLPEGAYKMTVEADKHEGFQTTIMIDPGRTNTQSVFLSFQAITYTWEVVPTLIEDKYEVQLVMKYETNVPVPVVVVEMPTNMPQLINDQTYPFLVTMTNKGLITAKDVEITFPQDDPEYIFLTNFSKLDLFAQQSIQVPVVMQRKLKAGSLSKSSPTGPCTNYAVTIYGWECGKDRKWQNTSNGITFTGRICPSSSYSPGGGGGYYYPIGRGGGGGTYYDPNNYTPQIEAPTIGCDKCLIDVAQAILGCVPLVPPVAVAVNIFGCLYSVLDFEISAMDVFNCAVSFTPAKYARDGFKCALGAANAAKTCYEDPPFFLSPNKAGVITKMPPILQQSVHDLEAFLYGNDATYAFMSEVLGNMDWQSKENFTDFVKQIEPFTKNMLKFQADNIATIKQNMAGTDITADEISAFALRWNNSLEAHNKHILYPTVEYPNIVDNRNLIKYIQRADSVKNYAISRGFASVSEMYDKSIEAIDEQVNEGRKSVCASVSINITQKVVMTREAFEGTLTIFNGHTTTEMKDIKLNLEIKDENGVLCNDLFQIETKALSFITGIDGTGTLGPQVKGSATVLFIPEKGAAPMVPKSYSFGGSFSYLDPFSGVTVTKPLYPVTLDVNPSPDLYLHYFMQRDILGDDPLTKPIEPIVPAEFAVMIQNNGYGIARSVRIESAQPKIVENEKGLAINFALIGSNLNGQPQQLGLINIDFGNIAPQKSSIGQWWFTCDLLGHFVSYETKLTHLDSRGNPDLSLISGVSLHELIKSVRIYAGVEDGINDFLVNEVQDAKELPDIIYLSNGGTLDVYPALSSSLSGSVTTGNHEIELLLAPSHAGWNYQKFSDPGNGRYKIVSVTRSDGQVIPLDNVWQTNVTLPDGKEPVYENMIHILDLFATYSTQKYTIKFVAKDQNPPEIVRFENVPATAATAPVTSVNVVFNKPIDPATFDFKDMTLRVQGGADCMDASVTVNQLDSVTYKIDLTSKSTQNGYYVLTVQASQIADKLGSFGLTGKQATWTQYINIPAISEFLGLPDNKVGTHVEFILLKFNLPIDNSTLIPARFTWKKDDATVSGNVTITEMDTEGKLFKISGLDSFLAQDGKYSMTVDLPNIKSLDGNNGMLSQSVEWEIDQKVPLISKISPSSDGGYDAQHLVSFNVKFNEPVKGFGVGSLELWKDGMQQPLSQINFTRITDAEYLFTEFRLLTYPDGNYLLKVKIKDITDIAGNSASDTVKYEWTVKRTLPKAVTNLHITPDMGFSLTDNITAVKNLMASMTVNEPGSRIQLYQTDQVNTILLADTSNVNAGALLLPISFGNSGNITLQAYCIDKYNNKTITEIPVFIDEAALICNWKNTPQTVLASQPVSLQIEFSDKLLDDTKLKENLKFELEGQVLSTQNLAIAKSTDKLYNVTGFSQSGNASGTYSLSIDLTKIQKYNSGKTGVTTQKTLWTILNENKAPVANAGPDQSLDEGTLVTLDGTGSTDADNDVLTYLWTAPAGIVLSSATVAKPTFTAPDVVSDTDYTISLVVNDGKTNSIADEVKITVKNIPTHFTTVWTGNGIDHMNINIYSAKMDGVELDAGDEVAIFDGTLCVGVGRLKVTLSMANTLDLVVSKNDGTGNGYTAGHDITFKFFDSSKNLEMAYATASYSNDNPSWSTDGKFAIGATSFAALTFVSKVNQEITMSTGWNIISSYAIPSNPDLMAIFQPMITAGTLRKVMDESGKTIENFGIFGGWKNNIGNFNSSKGYKVNVTAASTLSLEGIPVLLPYNINLLAGWNIISYPCSSVQDAKVLVQPLIDSGQLKKVMDEAGKTLENFGIFGGWKNNIGNFLPGKGYKVNVTADCILTITGTANKAGTVAPEVLAATNFTKVYSGNGTDHFNVHLVDLTSSGLVAGDQIGIFDGNYCVGAATISADQIMSGSVSIPSSLNDGLSDNVNGFTSGHAVLLQLYRNNQTYPLNPARISGSEAFEKNGSLFLRITASDLPVAKINAGKDQLRCYPNPFADQLTIEIRLTAPKDLEVRIYDLSGKLVRTLFKGEAGTSETLIWDGTNGKGTKMISGTYILKANEMLEKIALKK